MMDFLRYNLFGIVWGVFIAFLVLLPGQEMLPTDDLILFDRFAHMLVFTIWVLLLIVGFYKQRTFPKLHYRAEVVAVLLALGYGFLLEALQLFSSSRTFEWQDVWMNVLGCLLGWCLFWLIYRL